MQVFRRAANYLKLICSQRLVSKGSTAGFVGIGNSSTFVSSCFFDGAGLVDAAAVGLLVCLVGAAVVLDAGLLCAVADLALVCTAGFVY